MSSRRLVERHHGQGILLVFDPSGIFTMSEHEPVFATYPASSYVLIQPVLTGWR